MKSVEEDNRLWPTPLSSEYITDVAVPSSHLPTHLPPTCLLPSKAFGTTASESPDSNIGSSLPGSPQYLSDMEIPVNILSDEMLSA